MPACAFNVTTVGAVDDSMNIAYFSSRGPTLDGRIKPDVCAVGVSVTSAQANTNGYVTWQGTSMATPHVAGVYALLLEYNPSLSPSQIKQIIEDSAIDKGDAGTDNTYGCGVVECIGAVNHVAPVNHSIIVVNIDAPLSAEVNETIFVNSTIRNLGSNSETNVVVDLLVNSTIQNTTTIGFIQNGTSTNVSFSWKPSVAGEIYKIEIYAHPVPGETQVSNNLRKKLVVVPLDWVIAGKETVTGQTITVVGNLTVEFGGNLTLDDVDIFLTSVVDGQFGIFVENGGALYISNSTILPFYPLYTYKFVVYGNMTMVNCNVSYIWGVDGNGGDLSTSGLSIHSDNV
ncbi:MAG: S8 family serine peptidase, partial [Thermoplasmatales archaeon]|nr:S8 family serine peptidase [Thermoplasmatales archaeon]